MLIFNGFMKSIISKSFFIVITFFAVAVVLVLNLDLDSSGEGFKPAQNLFSDSSLLCGRDLSDWENEILNTHDKDFLINKIERCTGEKILGGGFPAEGGAGTGGESCSADLNGDGDVGAPDLAILLGNWGPNPGHPADFDGDGFVSAPDLAWLLGSWGACPTCEDGIQNQDETDVDCGGSVCGMCMNGQGCLNDLDCISGFCDLETLLCEDIRPSDTKRVFVTEQTWQGDLGGLEGADIKCMNASVKAGLNGEWKAWLSDSAQSALERLIHSSDPYILLDGTIVADNWDDLVDGTLDHPIDLTENLENVKSTETIYVWTGTVVSGEPYILNCDNWTSNSPNLPHGLRGNSLSVVASWTHQSHPRCSPNNHLYCFEQ